MRIDGVLAVSSGKAHSPRSGWLSGQPESCAAPWPKLRGSASSSKRTASAAIRDAGKPQYAEIPWQAERRRWEARVAVA